MSDRKTKSEAGFSLFELIITLSVLAILVVGTIPMTENAVRRQKEIRLRESLRLMRAAIDEFKRDTMGSCPQGAMVNGNPAANFNFNAPSDPRSRVVIDDCTIFTIDNIDRYPPTMEMLATGVKVRPRGINLVGGAGLGPLGRQNATDLMMNQDQKEIIKVYLRELPTDPMTGEKDWVFRSSYQGPDDSWDEVNVFDVRSNSKGEALNGEKYSDW